MTTPVCLSSIAILSGMSRSGMVGARERSARTTESASNSLATWATVGAGGAVVFKKTTAGVTGAASFAGVADASGRLSVPFEVGEIREAMTYLS